VSYEKPGAAWLGVVHRIDRPVSGVVVFARTSKSAARLSAQIAGREARKVYWGVGRGRPAAELGRAGEIAQWLIKDAARNRVRVAAGPGAGAREARTRWRILKTGGGLTLYELVPETGRPHQLRLAAAALGTPLCGDLRYGDREPLADRSIALHARSLELRHPTRGEPLRFEAPLPRPQCWSLAREIER
jgi:23S rRNA pseudouridine1911/1915/1917 synthase